MGGTTRDKSAAPRTELAGFIDKFDPKIRALTRAALAGLRTRMPGAHMLVYDNYNALVIGFCSSLRASDVIVSIGVYPRWVNLFFFNGPELPDPAHLLSGSGRIVRRLKVADAALLEAPAVRALVTRAAKLADPPLNKKVRGHLVIRSVSKKQRPRRPAGRA